MRWLILSLKWSESSEYLTWYRQGAKGYTCDVEQAGRFTEEESRRHTVPGVTFAVPESLAKERCRVWAVIPKDPDIIEVLRILAEKSSTRRAE